LIEGGRRRRRHLNVSPKASSADLTENETRLKLIHLPQMPGKPSVEGQETKFISGGSHGYLKCQRNETP